MATHALDQDFAGLSQAAANASIDKHGENDFVSKEKSESVDVSEGAYDDGPTDVERETLRRIPGPIPWPAYLVAFIELVERFSYYGSTAVFTNFIQQPLPEGSTTGAGGPLGVRSGALGLGQHASTGLGTFNSFWVYCTPLLGAYIADTYWGRYKTVCVAVAIALVGHVLLVIAAIPSVIIHPQSAVGVFALAIIIMGLGTGAFKSNISPMVAEQATTKRLTVFVTKTGERVLHDPALTASRIFMYFYLMINVGALVGQVGMVYAENNHGFWLAYLLPTIVFCLCPFVLYFGRNLYYKAKPEGSVLAKSIHIVKFAGKGKWTSPKKLTAPGFWEAAKPSNVPVSERPSWMNFDDEWVDEVRRGFKACKVFLWFPLYWLTYNQILNNLTSQAAVLNTHGLPNDILNNLNPFSLIILIPITDLLIYPALRRAGINFSPIRKITLGFFTGALAMMCAALVQDKIYKSSACGTAAATCDEMPFIDTNVWVQTPSYVLIAISEILASITGLEYAFTKAPTSMRSLVMSLFLFMSAISSAIGEAFLPLSADPLLVWNYAIVGVISFFAAFGFYFSFRHLDKDEQRLNELGERKFALAPGGEKQQV